MKSKISQVFAVLILAAGFGFWLFAERWRLLRPSTLAGLRAGGARNTLNLNALHMYLYGRWTNQYLNILLNQIFPRLDARGLTWWRERYHAKVLTPEHAAALIKLDRNIDLRDQEQIVPYPMARDIVLQGPPEVLAYECGCRHARSNHCEPTQVCMVVGQPFVDFVAEHNPQSSRRLTQEEALELLRAEHERGHVHTAWFKEACLDRFYSICNCCKCCCGGIEAMVKYGSPAIASSGFVAQVDESACQACGKCATACPFGALSVNGHAQVNWDKCMGCGVCEGQCSNAAISLVPDDRKGTPLDVRVLV